MALCSESVTVNGLIDDWNKGLQNIVEKHEQWNEDVRSKLANGQMSAEEAIAAYTPRPVVVKHPSRRWCVHWLRRFGWSVLTKGSEAQASLPYEHPDMMQARQYVRSLTSEYGCHGAMILNFDQVWRCCWSFCGKLYYKGSHLAGQPCKRQKVGAHVDKKLHMVKGSRRALTAARTGLSTVL